MSIEYLAEVYRAYQGEVSLKGFMRIVDQPYTQRYAQIASCPAGKPQPGLKLRWRLRDYLKGEDKRQLRQQALSQAAAEVKAAAAEDTSYGYRRVYQHLHNKGVEVGRECVRHLMINTRQCLAASVASNLSQERAAATLLEGDE